MFTFHNHTLKLEQQYYKVLAVSIFETINYQITYLHSEEAWN
jgi:hypothetical protein